MTGMEFIEVLGNLGDFLGAIAVFATIVYLSIQVRYSREATEANTRAIEEQRRQAAVDAFVRRAESAEMSLHHLADSAHTASIIAKIDPPDEVPNDPIFAQLTPDELLRYRFALQAQHARFEGQYHQYDLGYLDERSKAHFEAAIGYYGPQWIAFGLDFPTPFGDYVRKAIAATPDVAAS